MINLLIAIALLQTSAGPASVQEKRTFASLIPSADAIVVVLVSATDYSRTPSDGPMKAHAKVLSTVKGELKKNQSFEFTETAWVGPNYQAGEVRILFMESTGRNTWRVLSNLDAKVDFFIAQEAIPHLNLNSLKSALERLSPGASKRVLITSEMLKLGNR